jgi:anti-anti-sigma factor
MVQTETPASALPAFSWLAQEDGTTLRIVFRGDLDLAVVDECRAGLAEPTSMRIGEICLDLGGLTFMDSTGLALLVDLQRAAVGRRQRLTLSNVPEAVLRLFDLTGLASWFVYADGHKPERLTCPVCDREMLTISRKCPRCGAS